MNSPSNPGIVCVLASLLVSLPAAAQTFKVKPQQEQQQTQQQRPAAESPGARRLGFGTNIKVARRARAAEQALRQGNYEQAYSYAQAAAEAAPRDAHLWFLVGYAARMTGRTQASVQAFQRGLALQPNSVNGLSGLAQTYLRMGRTADAKRILMQVIATNPRRPNDLLVAGELFLRSGDYERAISLLQRSEALRPASRTELLLALAHMRNGQLDQGRRYLDMARKRDPRNPSVLRALGSFHREVRDYPSAIAALQQIKNPRPDVLAELGYTHQLAGNKEEAAAAYARAAKADPKNLGRQLAAARAQLALGATDEAAGYIQRAAALDADDYRVAALQGDLARARGDKPGAARGYELALSHMPESPAEGPLYPVQLRMNLYGLLNDLGDSERAQQQLAAARSQIEAMNLEGPQRSAYLRMRAEVKIASRDLEGAQSDLEQALKLDPRNDNLLMLYANVLWKRDQPRRAFALYQQVLERDPTNRLALSSLGFLSRQFGKTEEAEGYFLRLAKAHPKDHAPWLALGDMYTAQRKFERAQEFYERGYKLAPTQPLIVAGGANAAIEAQKLPLAKRWLDRAKGSMNENAYVMRERERYLTWTGNYEEAARLGRQVIEKLPRDRDAVVYLGYSLLYLRRYDELLRLVTQYQPILPKDRDLPLLAGYVHKNGGLLHDAEDDFTRVIELDPKTTTAYVNRGYVRNDLQDSHGAAEDFTAALKLQPNNSEAHLGLAFASLQLREYKTALEQADKAARLAGENATTHLVRATAYRGQALFAKAAEEYRALLRENPKDLKAHVALGTTLFRLRRFRESLDAYTQALSLSPDDPNIYARMAHAHASLGNRAETFRYIEAAERLTGAPAEVLLSTGDALLTLGDSSAAMERFERALFAPDSDRVQVRLAVARVMVRNGQWGDARQQISLAFAESRVGESTPISADHLLQAAGMMLQMREFDLAERLYDRAQRAGAAPQVAALGLANLYLAKGDPDSAEAQLASLGDPMDYGQNYDYALAMAQVHRQRRDMLRAISGFARADALSGEESVAEDALIELAGQQGLRLNRRFSVLSTLDVSPLFEDSTIYMLDAQFLGLDATTTPALLPQPRSSLETRWTNGYRFYQEGLPPISGFFQVRNARGSLSLPSEDLVVRRNTTDYTFNSGVNPVLRLGRAVFSFNTGLQFTLRRDQQSPFQLDQDLFRQYVYMSSNTLFNWMTVRGFAMHESGPFKHRDLRSRDLSGRLEFRVGRPWGDTALITGYWVRDLQFKPLLRENFATSSYAGIEQKFGDDFRLRVMGEYVRAWRVRIRDYQLAQAIRPAAEFEWRPARRWNVQGSFAYSRGQGFHAYDNFQTGFFVTYTHPFRRTVDDGLGAVEVSYPLRFSFGMEQQQFFNFTGGTRSSYRPVVRITLF